MPTRQFALAGEKTAARNRIPIFGSLDPTLVAVLATDQWEMEPHPPSLTGLGLFSAISPHGFNNSGPHTRLAGEKLRITKKVKSTSSSGQSYTGTVLRIEKSDAFLLVGAHEAEKDNVVPKHKVS